MVCQECKTDFSPKKTGQKYCSSKCRVYASRRLQKNVTQNNPKGEGDVTKEVVTQEEQPMPFDNVTLGYMDEYENLYLKKKAPLSMNQKAWDKYRNKKLEELKTLITNGKAE